MDESGNVSFDAPDFMDLVNSGRELYTGHMVVYLRSVVLLLTVAAAASGDLLLLKTDGRIEGTVLNPNQNPRTSFVVKLDSGGRVTVAADQVEEYKPASKYQRLYKRNLEKMPATAAANFKLAEWCAKSGLKKERQFHLLETVRLEPNHKKARQKLGHSLRGGQWMTRQEFMESRGMTLYDGRYRLPQEIEILKRKKQADQKKKEWAQKIKRWRGWIGRKREAEAIANFNAIEDAFAAPALVEMLNKENEPALQRLYIQLLGRLNTIASTQTFVKLVLGNVSEDMRDLVLDQLEEHPGRDNAIDAFIKSLSSSKNVVVRRAAVGLQRLPAERSVRPLIDALVTKHKVQISNSQPGQISTSFGGSSGGVGGGGGGGLSMGGGGPKFREDSVNNREVLDALLPLADGPDFEYNKLQWLRWLSNRDAAPGLNLRRAS